MKNKNIMLSIMIASLGLLSYSVVAQANNMRQDSAQNKMQYNKDEQNNRDNQNKIQDEQMHHSKTDHMMMQNGKMVMMKDGKKMPMEKDITLKNGTKCMTDGTCIKKDGAKTKFKEGEMMDMNGKMVMLLIKDDKTTK